MATTQPVYRPWTRKEYDRLIELGILHEDERVELIGGQMIVAEPKGSPHQVAIELTAEALRTVPGRQRDYRAEHPSRPVLIVEVAESSLAFDRRYKGSVYARAGIADYWIVNLRRRVLEVYREPVPASSARFGWNYASVRTFRETAIVSPLAAPAAAVAVADLLP